MILETIVTTQARDGSIHIAPMGVREDGERLVLAPFRPSRTLDNVLQRRCAVVNRVDDVRIFAGCLTGRREWPSLPAQRVAGVRLAAALAHSEVVLERLEDDPQRPRLVCRVVHAANHAPFRGFNRAQAAVIEAAILVSRLCMLPAEKIDTEIAYLAIAIDKTAGPAEREAWGWLMEHIRQYRAEAGAA
jgi:hypothetical protein